MSGYLLTIALGIFLISTIFGSTVAIRLERIHEPDHIIQQSPETSDENRRSISSELEGSGPIPTDVLLQNPRLSYLGTFNAKAFYLERTVMTQEDSVLHCDTFGMNLARFDILDELKFVYNNTESSDTYLWTDGEWTQYLTHFIWTTGSGSVANFPYAIFSTSDAGLTLDVYGASARLVITPYRSLYYPLCYL